MRKCSLICAALLLAAAARPFATADAATIDFEGLPFTFVTSGGGTPDPASIITNQFTNLGVVFGKTGVSAGVAVVRDTLAPSSGLNTVAGLDAAGILPGGPTGGALVGDIYFNFVHPDGSPASTNGVSFTIGDGGGDLDVFQIRSYDLGGGLIDTQNVSGISRFLVSIGVANIHSVDVDFTGDFGYSLDDLSFDTPQGNVVPLPAASWGGLSLLGVLGASRILRRPCRA